jgi:succinate dehydrogenase / fumarate reductase cytochrome b subunit
LGEGVLTVDRALDFVEFPNWQADYWVENLLFWIEPNHIYEKKSHKGGSMEDVKLTLTGLARYGGREGQLSFILHRLTGLGTLLFLTIHILDTATVYFFPSLYSHAIDIYRSTPFMIGEMFLVFSVIYHGVNGARIAIFDLFAPRFWEKRSSRPSAVWTLVVAIVLWLPTLYLMGRSLLVNNFGF